MAWRSPANRTPEAVSPGTATSSSIPTKKRDNKSNLRFAGICRFWRGQCGASSSRGSRRVYRESDEHAKAYSASVQVNSRVTQSSKERLQSRLKTKGAHYRRRDV